MCLHMSKHLNICVLVIASRFHRYIVWMKNKLFVCMHVDKRVNEMQNENSKVLLFQNHKEGDFPFDIFQSQMVYCIGE